MDNHCVNTGKTDEKRSDSLLMEHGFLGLRKDTRTEAQLLRRFKNEKRFYSKLCRDTRYNDDMFDQLLDDLVDKTGINQFEYEVIRMHAYGYRSAEIARILGTNKMRVTRARRRAASRLREAYLGNPYAGWYTVYRDEVSRGVHCRR